MEGQQAQYESQLRREEMSWQAQADRVIQSDRAAVDIGLVALKTAILVNAGALVALLALVGQLWDHHSVVSAVVAYCRSFVRGLAYAVVASAVAYIYQSTVTYSEGKILESISANPSVGQKTLKHLVLAQGWVGILMLALVAASIIEFGLGVIGVADALEK